ncbi:EpaQ family protein, partial [Enterococcus faecalis]|uniref:EpaQ family protein n=1 Tax=Enterococcus faecalis TaxID=1351 RepID=UPI003CC55A5B
FLLIVSLVALSATLYRMSVQLPQLIPADEIFKESNKLERIWINTNTIGATLMFSTMMASSLIKANRNKVFNLLLLPVYIGGVLGTWVS